jgi:hypothetical protein
LYIWKDYFSWIHRVSDVRQIEIHIAETLVPEPSPLMDEIAVAKLKGINYQALTKFWQK